MLDVLTNALAFLFALAVIIFVHEAGHLLMAKAFGVRVLTFSLGFGRRIWGFERGGTDYRVSLVPLGGYVRLGGEEPDEVSDDPAEFLNKPRWQRVLVYLAGPAMNVVLSVLLIAGAMMAGVQVAGVRDAPAVVGTVEAGSPAEAAGLESGDKIVSIDGAPVEKWSKVQFEITTSPEQRLEFVVERGGRTVEVTLEPVKVPKYEFGYAGVFPELLPSVSRVVADSPAAKAGFEAGDEIRAVDGQGVADQVAFVEYIQQHPAERVEVRVARGGKLVTLGVVPETVEDGTGRIGVELRTFARYGPVEALVESVRYNWQVAGETMAVLGKIFTGRLKARSALSGPIEIAAHSGAAARQGFTDLIFLMGLISVSIAILNLLPIPVLDGGQIAMLLVESVLRRDLPLMLKERIHQVGFVLILLLMVTVLYFDLTKNLPAGLLPGS